MIDERRTQCERIGSLMLYWAGFEDDDAAIHDAPMVEAFIEAIGNSSIPEACGVIAEGMEGRRSR